MEADGLTEALGETDKLAEDEGLSDAEDDGLFDADGLGDKLTEDEGLAELLVDEDGLTEALTDAEGEELALGELLAKVPEPLVNTIPPSQSRSTK